MKKLTNTMIWICLYFSLTAICFSQKSPYPMIFVHGINSSANFWLESPSIVGDLLSRCNLSNSLINICLDSKINLVSQIDSKELDVKIINPENIGLSDIYLINFDVDYEGDRNPINDDDLIDENGGELKNNILDLQDNLLYEDKFEIKVPFNKDGDPILNKYLKPGDIIRINNEYMLVNTIEYQKDFQQAFINVTRGWFGSDITGHFITEKIWIISNQSNQASVAKQGYGLKLAIDKIKSVTGSDKVILVGHSLGGLAIRQFAQVEDTENSIAKLITVDSPNLGSVGGDWALDNFFTPLILEWKNTIDKKSEAARDALYNYSNSSYDPNFPGEKDDRDCGIYLFGGNENQLSNVFLNKDINSNGIIGDNITGLNNEFFPNNFEYYFFSSWCLNLRINWGLTDGAIRYYRQYIFPKNELGINYDISEVLALHGIMQPANFLTTCGGAANQLHEMYKSLDEPDVPQIAYELKCEKHYINFSSLAGNNNNTIDYDWYKVKTKEGYISISVDNIVIDGYTRKGKLDFFNQPLSELNNNSTPHSSINFSENSEGIIVLNPNINLSVGEYYIRITHQEIQENDWETPFILNVTQDLVKVDFIVDKTTGIVGDLLNFEDKSVSLGDNIVKWIWDFGDGNTETKYSKTVSHQYQYPGLFSVKLIVQNSIGTFEKVKEKLIYVNPKYCPDIVSVSYSWDGDPKTNQWYDLEQFIPVQVGNFIEIDGIFPLTYISTGLHQLHIRMKNANGKWSIPQTRSVYVDNIKDNNLKIVEVESFIDNDPGLGYGNKISIYSNSYISKVANVDLSNVNLGFHRIYTRAKDSYGAWSIPQVKSVLIENTFNSKISEVEYYIENDPGIGNGKKLNVSSNFDISIDDSISLMEFSSPDTLTLFARAKNENGVWSFPNAIGFIIKDSSFKIILNSGWNMISSYLQSFEPDSMNNVLDDVAGNMLIAKDISGDVYIPQYNINTIGKWDVTQGYQLYMTQTGTLSVTGVEVIPSETPIQLTVGWNMISYLRNSEMSAELALASITDNNNLLIAKTLEGTVFIPSFSINTIGNMKPGIGYRVYVTTADTLVYPGN